MPLPILDLDNIRVASPCPKAWQDMEGDDRVRHCGDCQKNVYNLSGLRRVEAEALVREHEGALCIRYYARKDGSIITTDCPVGVALVARAAKRAVFAAAALAVGVVVSVLAVLTLSPAQSRRLDQARRGLIDAADALIVPERGMPLGGPPPPPPPSSPAGNPDPPRP